jgi:hypothetical protein
MQSNLFATRNDELATSNTDDRICTTYNKNEDSDDDVDRETPVTTKMNKHKYNKNQGEANNMARMKAGLLDRIRRLAMEHWS